MALDAKKRRAIELLASGYTQGEAAKEVGVSRQAINGWVNQDAEFGAEYDAVLKAQSAAFVRDMRGAAARVAIRWQSLIDSDDESIALRALLAWVEKFGVLQPSADEGALSPELTERALKWLRDEQAKQQAGANPQSKRYDGSDPDGTSD